MLTAGVHWTEAGTDAGTTAAEPGAHQRQISRARRLGLINRILKPFGCAVEDWSGGKYIVRGFSGRAVLVDHLPQIWAAAEDIAKRPLDPLDPALLQRLER